MITIDQKKVNEHFFSELLNTLKEGGVYGWPTEQHFYTKKGNTLSGSEVAVKRAKEIVTEEFGNKFFSIQK